VAGRDGEPSASRPTTRLPRGLAILSAVIVLGYIVALVEAASLPGPSSWWAVIVLVLSALASAYAGMNLGRYLNRRHRSRLAHGGPEKGPGPGFPIVIGLLAALGPVLGKVAGGGRLSDGLLIAVASIVLTFVACMTVGALRSQAQKGADGD
jgi:hypothetical protein